MPTSYAEPETARTPALPWTRCASAIGRPGRAAWPVGPARSSSRATGTRRPARRPRRSASTLPTGAPRRRARRSATLRAPPRRTIAPLSSSPASTSRVRSARSPLGAARLRGSPATTRGTASAARRRPTRSAPRATPQRCDWHVLRPSSQTSRWGGSQRRGATPARASTWSRGARIADLLRWGLDDGSVGWTTGLGRLFQRAAECWAAEGDYERAAVAYELAIPLVPASGAESPERVVLALAALDRDNGFDVRALTRSRSAVAALRDVENALEQPLEWARCIVCLQDLILGQVGATSTAGGMSVAALDWATEGLRQLLALPGVPPAGPEPPEPADIAGQIATYAHMARPLSGGPTPKPPSSAASWPRGSGPLRRPTGGTRRLSRGRPLCPGSPPPGR